MLKKYNDAKLILIYGFMVFMSGLLGLIFDGILRSHNIYPFSFGIILGFGAQGIIGLFAILIGSCLKKIEERLDKIERSKGSE